MSRDRVVLLAGLAAWTVVALVAWLAQPPLGHDEAQYAIAARDLVTGAPQRWIYVSQGTAALAVPGVLAGGSELALRFVPMLLSFTFVLACWNLARHVAGARVAAWLVCVLAASFGIVRRNAELLSDMPATAGLVAGATVLVVELVRDDGPRWRIALAAPAFAAAFYLRYGSVVPIAAIGLAAAAGGWRGIARAPLRVVATLALFVVLLAPHLVSAHAHTGSPLGIVFANRDVIAERTTSVGLVDYLTANPLSWYGVIATPLLVLGIASIAWVRDRRCLILWASAIATVIGLGLTGLAQSRYIFYALVVLLALGVERVHRFVLPLALATVVSWALALVWIVRGFSSPMQDFIVDAAAAIHADARDRPCNVYVSTAHLTWYCRCTTVYEIRPEDLATLHYVVTIPPRIVPGQELPGTHVTLLERGRMRVLRLDR